MNTATPVRQGDAVIIRDCDSKTDGPAQKSLLGIGGSLLSVVLLTCVIALCATAGRLGIAQGDESVRSRSKNQKENAERVPPAVTDQTADSVPLPPIPRTLRSDAIVGTPYGAAQLTIPLKSDRKWRPDQPLIIRVSGERILYPCHSLSETEGDEELVVRFLFRGSERLVIDVESSQEVFAKGYIIPVDIIAIEQVNQDNGGAHETLLSEWWKSYRAQLVVGPSNELSTLGRELTSILGRRLGLPISSRVRNADQSSALERQFERTIGMLFGFESVRLAMMNDTSHVASDEGLANRPLPNPIGVQASQIPTGAATNGSVEPLASHIPPECFYLRCGTFENYLWLRGFVRGWGGSLDEMVATPVVDYQIRERIERQLCLDPAVALKLELDKSLRDFALVGRDIYFAEGAAVGVLMLAKDSARVHKILEQMRENFVRSYGGVNRKVTIKNRSVSFCETSDNVIRSFHVTDGDYHLVTNSQALVEQFLDCGRGRNLAALAEFRYARSKIPPTEQLTSFLYLSDPFFRNLVSPSTRIEVARRRRAAAELRLLSLARLVARAEGLKADSIADLIQYKLLPQGFGGRPDNSSPCWTADGRLVDSLRGALGTFLPIADVNVNRATDREVNAYSDFTARYLKEWRAMDPVTIAMNRQSTADPRDERVDIEIVITPYARNAYEFLARYLAPASGERVKSTVTDVLALTARLQQGAQYDVCVGLRDVSIPFRIEKGELIKEGDFENRKFADWRSYAAVTPSGMSGLSLLNEFSKNLQSRQIGSSTQLKVVRNESRSSRPAWLDPLAPAVPFPLGIAYFSYTRMSGSIEEAFIQTERNWTAMSWDRELRREVAKDLTLENNTNESQIQLRVRDVNSAKIGPYLHAVSWETGRRLSSENAIWLTRVAATLRLDLAATRGSIEPLLGGTLQCPLGGKYELRNDGPSAQFVSTAWGHSSRFDETAIPADYRLPFLAWLRGMSLDFQISPTTLTSRVKLHVNPTVVKEIIRDVVHTGNNAVLIKAAEKNELAALHEHLLLTNQQLTRALERFDSTGAWTKYLEIPTNPPQNDNDWKQLRLVEERFKKVSDDRKSKVITRLNGFTETHSRLKEYIETWKPDELK